VSSHPGHVWIDGIQVRSTASSPSSNNTIIAVGVAMATGDEVRISNNIVKGVTTASSSMHGIQAAVDVKTMKIWNNIVYDCRSSGGSGGGGGRGIFAETGAAGTFYVYNNTVHNCHKSYERAGGTFIAKNNISQSDVTDGFVGTFDAASNYNISDRAADAPGANSKSGTSVTFVNEAGDIFLLDAADTGAQISGTDLSADANLPITTDILNSTRTVIWDMGAHEVSIGGIARRKWIIR